MRRSIIVLHSALAPSAVADALNREIDSEQWTPFGFRGSRDVLGKVVGNRLRLRKRRFYRQNCFAGMFYGTFEPEPGGTRIEGHFDSPLLPRCFMWFWLAGAVLLGTPMFLAALIDVVRRTHYGSGDEWVGLLVPPCLVAAGIGLPVIGRLQGRTDERFILQFIQETLAARVEDHTHQSAP